MTSVSAVHHDEQTIQTILKAVVVGSRVQDPACRPGGDDDTSAAFASAGALQPPYGPEARCLLVEHSNSLRQNIDAYATNIDGFGYRFEPAIDLDAEDVRQKVADELALERGAAREASTHSNEAPVDPTPEEVTARLAELRKVAHEEVNYLYFKNKSVPPMALLVSGGRLSKSSVPRIERFIEENLKDKANFHKTLILEVDGAGTAVARRSSCVLSQMPNSRTRSSKFTTSGTSTRSAVPFVCRDCCGVRARTSIAQRQSQLCALLRIRSSNPSAMSSTSS